MTKKILIVDDEVDILKLIASRLAANQYQVVTAENGPEGLEKTLSEKPDLVILDVLMPGMTGYQMLEKIRELQDEIRNVPIIVMSARASMKRFFDTTHVRHFISKPFNPKDLLEEVEKTLKDSRTFAPPSDNDLTIQGDDFLNGKTLLITGMDEYLLRKITAYFEERGHTVLRGHDEDDTVKQMRKRMPSVVLAQYWEEYDKFDAEKIYKEFMADARLQKSSFFVFCSETLSIEAMKSIPKHKILTYFESSDLISKIENTISK